MLYNLFEFLEQQYQFPGASVFQYISFRSALAIITSLLVSLVFLLPITFFPFLTHYPKENPS